MGSELRADDIAGILVARHLKKLPARERTGFRVFLGETAPENLTGEIRKYNPTHIVVVDSAEFGGKTGAVAVMDIARAAGGVTFSTHSLPLTIMLRYLLALIDCEVAIVGIQPGNLEFGEPASKTIERAAERVARAIREAVHEPGA